jgi:hypothetical protein
MEVLTGLAIAAIALASMHGVLVALDDGGQRAVAQARLADVDANGDRMLHDLIEQLELGADSADQFSGSEVAARFMSWCDVAGGWAEPCAVTMEFGAMHGRHALIARLSTGDSVSLRAGFTRGQLLYLPGEEGREGERWLRSWGAGIVAPMAIGIVLDGDTIVVRVGDRG